MEIKPYFKITRYSHFFSVTEVTPPAMSIVLNFSIRYVQKGFVREGNRTILKPIKIFAVRINSKNEFRFHIGQYADFINTLEHNGLNSKYYTIEDVPLYTPDTIVTTVNPRYEEREYQTNVINFLTKEEIGDNRSRLVGLQTGAGKGICSLTAASRIGYKTLIIVLPKYIQKWALETEEALGINPKDILLVQGGKELKSLMHISNEQGITAKFIIISLSTIQNLYNDYKDMGDDILENGYPYLPEKLCEKLKVGTLIFDEAHLHLHAIFKVLLHTHIHKVIALTATLISNDPFIDRMQNIIFPKEIRYDKVPMDKYIKLRCFSYGFANFSTIRNIRTSARGSNTYSHIEFEKSIMKNKTLLNNYLDIIVKLVNFNYINGFIPGDKAVVFAASIAMCNMILNRLIEEFPRLDVRRYVEQDPYENVIDADIRVSTILSAGTALDIPNLRVAILTNSVQSPVSNLQALGRLRKLKDRDVTFCYLYNVNIKKQVDYHIEKKDLFADRIASMKEYKLEESL